ncbi:MAG: hypothetical protein R3C58_07980 [Parvularculaceae bacterium]
MDSIREIFDALHARIRSPIFGSIAVFFAILNWKALFFLAFANATASDRIQFFDDHTTYWSTLIFPILGGIAFAIASPWIALFSAWAAEEPTTRRKIRQTKSIDKILTEKMRLEKTRIQFLANEESALIEAAKRDEEVKEIADPSIRDELRREIQALREDTIKSRLNRDELAAQTERYANEITAKKQRMELIVERLSQLETLMKDLDILDERRKNALALSNINEIELVEKKIQTRRKRMNDLLHNLYDITAAS